MINFMDNQEKYLVAFSRLYEIIGPQKISRLLEYFSSAENAWNANLSGLIGAGLKKETAEKIVSLKNSIHPEKEMEKLEKERIVTIALNHPFYPRPLKEISHPPLLLYVRGSLEKEPAPAIAVVGSRKPTLYGKQAASQICPEIARAGITIISGLAVGIDTIAHHSALENNGRTIAVIGSGLDYQSVYPPLNRKLAEKIVSSGGAVISEYPPQTPALPYHFPARNRIISGLSWGALVIEAKEKSGALITAKYSLEQNREVFAVPGPIYSENSRGTNNLIKAGAKLVQTTADIFEEINPSLIKEIGKNNKMISADTPEEEKIIGALSEKPTHIDKIVNLTKMDTSTVNSFLAIMEIQGKIKNLGQMMYIINN